MGENSECQHEEFGGWLVEALVSRPGTEETGQFIGVGLGTRPTPDTVTETMPESMKTEGWQIVTFDVLDGPLSPTGTALATVGLAASGMAEPHDHD